MALKPNARCGIYYLSAMCKRYVPFLVFVFLMMSGCMNHLFYNPNSIIYETPEQYGLKFEDVFFTSADGTRLHGWFFPSSGKEKYGTVIHFHGNYANITYYLNQVRRLPEEGFDLFTFDYRGYGKSEGVPSRRGVYEDSIAAIKHVLSRQQVQGGCVFVFGQSLGGAVAITVVAENSFPEIRAMAVESSFCSYRKEAFDQMAAATRESVGNLPCLSLQLWPVTLLTVTDGFSPEKSIARISPLPLLLIYGTEDKTVSYCHGLELFKRANAPKLLWTVEGGQHLNIFLSSDEYTKKLARFFKSQ